MAYVTYNSDQAGLPTGAQPAGAREGVGHPLTGAALQAASTSTREGLNLLPCVPFPFVPCPDAAGRSSGGVQPASVVHAVVVFVASAL